jgi:acrylyl-CoA reductase (NADPH)
MKKSFRAFRVQQKDKGVSAQVTTLSWEDLVKSDVIIEGHYSSVNFKDALACTGRGKILKHFPLTAGIDFAGTVVSDKTGAYRAGDPVLVTGCGIGEVIDGGYAEFLSVPAESVVPLPNGLTLEEAMVLGTAGFTAALSLSRLEQNGQTPQKGPIVVTGASGGVGTVATDILSNQGYEVWSVSGKAEAEEFLLQLGARRVLTPAQLELGTRPLESVRFAGAIDNVGGELLAGLLRHVDLWGNVASVGLAGGSDLSTTVMPFVLRGVSVLGISSNNCPRTTRLELWRRLAGLWRPKNLAKIYTETISLDQLPQAFERILDRKVMGRMVVDLRRGN